MTSYMLCIINDLKESFKKHGIKLRVKEIIMHNENKLNMVTSEKGLMLIINISPSVAISVRYKNIDIELYLKNNTSRMQSLALYLGEYACRQNGGRTADQANANSNLLDSGNHKIFHMKFHGLSKLDRSLNSVMLMSIRNNLTSRAISYYTREKRNTFRKDKRTFYSWPLKWQTIERKVLEGQMKLCVLAKKYGGTDKKEILSYQRKLALSLNFRLLAVRKVTTNKGKNTPGVDGKLITSGEEKCKMVEDLK